MFTDSSKAEIDLVMSEAWQAFHVYRKMSLQQRAVFMKTIAIEIEAIGDLLIQTATAETNLPETRLRNERGRTILQLNQYAVFCEEGTWLNACIDTGDNVINPPKPDIRKMMIPLGPVVIFGSSNFPFAYSTAGGDTASAFAAGCPVIIKAHPAHLQTSTLVAAAIFKAAEKCSMPKGIFAHVFGKNFEVGKNLVSHPKTKAVGFTGSFNGGKQLFDWANQRKEPIPVFAEMGSVNPIFLLPEKLNSDTVSLAQTIANSITLGVGQFCTNPGLLIGIESDALHSFIHDLGKQIQLAKPATMLHEGISNAYQIKKADALLQEDVHLIAEAETNNQANQGVPTVATTSGKIFLKNSLLHQEIFGPFSLVIRCSDREEMIAVAKNLEGQLTATLMATENDFLQNKDLVEALKNICGRFIINSVPTGVEVCTSMQHGGPFPASTDSRFTAVGIDGIKRFVRPIAFQNWKNEFLPNELKDENPQKIWRTVNGQLVKGAIFSN